MFSDHIKTTTRYPCKITLVEPQQQKIQGLLRGGPIHIQAFTTNPFFRWPRQGENWTVVQENGTWYLDEILQNNDDPTFYTELEPGDALLNIPGQIHTAVGTTVARKVTQVVGDGSKKAWTVSHNLNTLAITVSVIATAFPGAPITAFTWKPEALEGNADPNKIEVNLTSAPAKDGALVVVIG